MNVTADSDASGAFVLPAFTIRATAQGAFFLNLHIAKQGYHSMFWKAVLAAEGPSAMAVEIQLLNVNLTLPIGASLSLDLSPNDPVDYVGEIYASDFCWNCRRIYFSTPSDADVQVVLQWSEAGSPPIKMWALDGAIVSVPDGVRVVLTLPRGTTGTLLVGAPSSGLDRILPFTLVTSTLTSSW